MDKDLEEDVLALKEKFDELVACSRVARRKYIIQRDRFVSQIFPVMTAQVNQGKNRFTLAKEKIEGLGFEQK